MCSLQWSKSDELVSKWQVSSSQWVIGGGQCMIRLSSQWSVSKKLVVSGGHLVFNEWLK